MTRIVKTFTTEIPHWVPSVTPVDPDKATPQQCEALKDTPSNQKVSDYVLVLAHDPETLAHRTPLFNGVMYGKGGLSRGERELASIGASVVNRCIYCTAVHASRFITLSKQPEVVDRIFADETEAVLEGRQQAIFDAAVRLSRTPPDMTDSDMDVLREAGLNDLEILDLILSAALFGWANRLMHTLGEAQESAG